MTKQTLPARFSPPIVNSLGSNYSLSFALQALRWWMTPDAAQLPRLTTELEELLGGAVTLTYKGRDALTVLLRRWGFGPGDIVLTQAVSCYAIEYAIAQTGATPVFVDVAAHSCNLSVQTLAAALPPLHQQAKVAVLVQHILGVRADMADIKDWCQTHQALLIDDLAQAITLHDFEAAAHVADGCILSFGQDKVLDTVIGGAAVDRRELTPPASDVTAAAQPPQLQPLNRWQTLRDVTYPLISLTLRKTLTTPLHPVLFHTAKFLHLLDSPVRQKYTKLHTLPAWVAPLVRYRLQTLPQDEARRRAVTAAYTAALNSTAQTNGLLPKQVKLPEDSALLRFPILCRQPDVVATAVQRHRLFLSDRWYRQPLDSGSLKYVSTYEQGSCPESEQLTTTLFNLPTHAAISPSIAKQILQVVAAEAAATTTQAQPELITAEADWQAVVAHFPEANFLQAWGWGEFQASLGKTVLRLVVRNTDGQVAAAAQAVIEPARRGRYMAVAGGPLLNWHEPAVVQQMLHHLQTQARQQRALFIRFRPQEVVSTTVVELLRSLDCVAAPMHLTADLTTQLDLRLSEVELLKNMRKQTRQAIRKAESLGITTHISTQSADIQQMYQDQLQLAAKHGFVPFSLPFWQQQFDAFVKRDQVFLVHAVSSEGEELATAFIIHCNGEAVYHYGTSTPANERLPGSYACQWAAIRHAQALGNTRYNFWGVAPLDQPQHRFAGVSLFKRGFGGQEVAYIPAQDIVLSRRYYANYLLERLRKKIRHL